MDGRRHAQLGAPAEASPLGMRDQLQSIANRARQPLVADFPQGPHYVPQPLRVRVDADAELRHVAPVLRCAARLGFRTVELEDLNDAHPTQAIRFDPAAGVHAYLTSTSSGLADLTIRIVARGDEHVAAHTATWSVIFSGRSQRPNDASGLKWDEAVALIARHRRDGGRLAASVELSLDTPWRDVRELVRRANALLPTWFEFDSDESR